jgi:hypothetical protein
VINNNVTLALRSVRHEDTKVGAGDLKRDPFFISSLFSSASLPSVPSYAQLHLGKLALPSATLTRGLLLGRKCFQASMSPCQRNFVVEKVPSAGDGEERRCELTTTKPRIHGWHRR